MIIGILSTYIYTGVLLITGYYQDNLSATGRTRPKQYNIRHVDSEYAICLHKMDWLTESAIKMFFSDADKKEAY